MKTYTPEELQAILAKHKAWLNNEEGGERANLSCANLRDANLSFANLRGADLISADLSGADLSFANLRGANLISANLSFADLSDADLRSTSLSDANLRDANLSSADLSDANLSDANLSSANLRDADLSSANLSYNVFFGGSHGAPVYQACRGFGSRNATLTLLALGEPEEWLFFTGCFRGTRAELEASVAKNHGETKEQANYLRAVEYLWQTALSNR